MEAWLCVWYKPAMTAHSKTLYLIDVSGFIFRAYHALPPLTSPDGTPTGAVFGFCNMIFKLLEDYRPDFIAAVLDTGKPSFRKELYADYKANRPPPPEDLIPQFPLVEEVLSAFNITRIGLERFEADDVIATLARQGGEAGMAVTIVSSDKDLMQLTSKTISLLDTMKNKRFDPLDVEKKFGVPPYKLGDYLALVGDASDNVPGVPGVGAKTAARLLTDFDNLQTILSSVDKVSGARIKKNLVEHAEQARLSRKLVELEQHCPISVVLEDLQIKAPDSNALQSLFDRLGFTRLKQKIVSPSTLDRGKYRTILSEEELQGCIEDIRQAGRFAVDLETTSLDPVSSQIVGISLCWGAGKACYIPVSHVYLGMPPQLRLATVLSALEPILVDPHFPKYGQNHKFDWIVLKRAGIDMQGVVCDAMLASYVLDPMRNSHGLDSLAADFLGHKMIAYGEVTEKKKKGFDAVEIQQATEYAAEDAEATFLLAELLGKRVNQDPKLADLLKTIELPLSRVLAEMELYGVRLDVAKFSEMSRQVTQQLQTLEREIQAEAGWEVNINSPKQLQKLLFQDLGLTTGRKTKTGYSTDADVLADLAIEHAIVAKIEEFRTLSKLKGTYLDALPSLINRETQRVHTSYNQAVTATGRLSSSDPNLQNIPIRTDLGQKIREAFIPPEGWKMISADYSQIELRILAHLAEDPALLEAFHQGGDVHRRTAAEIFSVPLEEVTGEQRRVAKAVNFGVIYGQTDFGLARQLRIPKHLAKIYIESYFARYAGVKRYMEHLIENARQTQVVTTILGRKRPLPDINSKSRNPRLYAERIARNTPIQGTAADLMKLAMLRVDAALKERELKAPMILTVHDEIVLEVRPQDVEEVSTLVSHTMSSVMQLDVPLKVDLGVGDNWAEAHS